MPTEPSAPLHTHSLRSGQVIMITQYPPVSPPPGRPSLRECASFTLSFPTYTHPTAPVQTGGFKTKISPGCQVELLGVAPSWQPPCSVLTQPGRPLCGSPTL